MGELINSIEFITKFLAVKSTSIYIQVSNWRVQIPSGEINKRYYYYYSYYVSALSQIRIS